LQDAELSCTAFPPGRYITHLQQEIDMHTPQVQLRSLPPAAAPAPHGNGAAAGMRWSPPACEDLRFGFEITLYVANR